MITISPSTALGLITLIVTIVGGALGVLWSLRSAIVKLNTLLVVFEKREDKQDERLDKQDAKCDEIEHRLTQVETRCEGNHAKK